jgi:plastocyanin
VIDRARTSRRSARTLSAALWLSAIAAIVAAAVVAALSGDAGGSTTRKPVTHTIVMEGTSFEPAAITVTLGDSVVWVNKDFFPHTATADGVFDSSLVPAGKSWTYTPATKGDVAYVCTLHPTMKGTLRVR